MARTDASGVRFNGVEAPGSKIPVCDFCLGTKPVWDYPCEDFVMLDMESGRVDTTEFYGAWTACETCAMLIEHDDKAELAARCARGNGADSEVMLGVYRLLVNNFMRGRGTRVRFSG